MVILQLGILELNKMSSLALKMTPQERMARSVQKKAILAGFLASGEVYTTLKVVAVLLGTSERNALRLLQGMVKEKLLRIDERSVGYGARIKIYGATNFALCLSNAHPMIEEFHVGKLNLSFLNHHIHTQLIRIKAERNGWNGWVPGRVLYKQAGMKKIPDALATRPDGHRAAFEVELNLKSKSRFSVVLAQHLSQIVNQRKYDLVYYITPHKAALDRAFSAVQYVVIDGKKITLNDSHKARFKTFDIKTWKGEQ